MHRQVEVVARTRQRTRSPSASATTGPGIEADEADRPVRPLLPLADHGGRRRRRGHRAVRVRPPRAGDGRPGLGASVTGRGRRVRVRAPGHARGLKLTASAATEPPRGSPTASAAMPRRPHRKFDVSSKNPSLKFMPIIPARTTAGQQHRRQQCQDPHDVVGALRHPAHVDVEGAEQPLAQPLDRSHRRLDSIDQPGPRSPIDSSTSISGKPASTALAMRRERPSDQADAASQERRCRQGCRRRAPVQRTLVEGVDLALDQLGEQEVADDDLVDERRT